VPLQFFRAFDGMDVWSASSHGFSFVISYDSPERPDFHGNAGYWASWHPVYLGSLAVEITGAPFKSFTEAEAACNSTLNVLNEYP
jgi:hypothetical protein